MKYLLVYEHKTNEGTYDSETLFECKADLDEEISSCKSDKDIVSMYYYEVPGDMIEV